MQDTTMTALAASLRVIGDELITMADALKADATVAPLAQDAQQAFAQPPAQTQPTQPPAQQWTPPAQQQQPPVQQQQPPPVQQQAQPAQQQQWQPPAQQTQQQPPIQQQQWQQPAYQQQQQPPVQQQQTTGMEAPTAPTTPPPTNDEFTAFSNELIALGRQVGPQGLGPIMGAMLQRYAGPPTNDLPTVPVESYGPFIEEVRAWVQQQTAGGPQ